MSLRVANSNLMCSTLVVGNFETHDNFKTFVEGFRRSVKNSKTDKHHVVSTRWSRGSMEYCAKEDRVLDGNDVSDFGFIVGTVEDDDMTTRVREWFEKLGFTVTRKVYNDKNETKCHLVWAEVAEFLDKLERAEKEISQKERKT